MDSNTVMTAQGKKIIFHHKQIGSDLQRYLTEYDVFVLLNRLPVEEYQHLRSVTFETCLGGYTYGYVHLKRVNSIVLCDQSVRTTINTLDARRNSLHDYGALPNMKWPNLAVRRYLLYNTFLHELGHTRLINPEKKRLRKNIPLEKQAQEYAEYWRGELYRTHFDHADPVHNLPSEEEKDRLQAYWPHAMKHLDQANRYWEQQQFERAQPDYQQAIDFMRLYQGDDPAPNIDVLPLEEKIQQIKLRWHIIKVKKSTTESLHDWVVRTLVRKLSAIPQQADPGGSGEPTCYCLLENRLLKIQQNKPDVMIIELVPVEDPTSASARNLWKIVGLPVPPAVPWDYVATKAFSLKLTGCLQEEGLL